MASYHYPSEEERKKWGNPEGYRNWLAKSKLLEGDLHRMEWYRVVLDEAHAIKNNTSRTSIACQNLNAKFRWALSGTPIQNRLEELFPYFRFLRAEWASHFDQFRKQYCDPDADDATARISVVLSIVMM
jgi:SNF2 family DNA or RNA helicase